MTKELAAPAMDQVQHSAKPLVVTALSATSSTKSDNENSDGTTHPRSADGCASIMAAGHEAGRAEAVLPGKCPPPSLIAPVGRGQETESRSDDAETRNVHLVRAGGGDGAFRLARGPRLRNNLSWVVGCLELANAGDFAANVWNELPVPLFVAVLMGVGGSLAAMMSVFAFRDARRAWRNMRFLRQQRRELRLRRRRQGRCSGPAGDKCPDEPESRALDVLLAVSFRELGAEVINRWAMDVLMGFGAVLISAGTFMAIGGGAAEEVFRASNLLSGWIGNTPIAAFGLVNAAWAVHVWLAARAHVGATRRLLPGSRAAGLVRRRSRNVQVFCVVNGSASVLGGGASMLTSIYWWGYVLLIPVIVSSVFCNLWWRARVGYTRSGAWPSELGAMAPTELARSLEFAARAEIIVRERQEQERKDDKAKRQRTRFLRRFVTDPSSLPQVLAFFLRHDLFEDLCLDLVSDPSLRIALCGADPVAELEIGPADVLALPAQRHVDVIDKAEECVGRVGLQHFRDRERHTAELLGTYCAIVGAVGSDAEDSGEKAG